MNLNNANEYEIGLTVRRARRGLPFQGFLFGLLMCSLVALVHAQEASEGTEAKIRGRLLDATSLEPVVQALVVLHGTDLVATTDREGRFTFSDIRSGSYSFNAIHPGYQELRLEGIRTQLDDQPEIELQMIRRAVLEEITVTPGSFSFMEAGSSARQTLSREDIESVPQLGEDVFRAVNRLPGLSSGDYSAHFSIRGGRHDETLILLDGLELYEPYHLKDFNEGAISIVDAETIDGVQLMTGGFPAQYGNKRSGVFEITSRTPELDRTRYSIGLSFMNARAMARGPLWNGRGSWLVSGRSGYMDLVFGLIQQDQLPSPRYQDVFAKMRVDLNPNHILSAQVLYAGDRYKFDAPGTTGFMDSLNTHENASNHYGNSYAWTTLESALGSKAKVRTMISASLVTRSRDGSERYDTRPEPLYMLSNSRDFSILGFKQDWKYSLSSAYALELGIDARRFHNTDRFRSVVNQDPNDPSTDPNQVYPVTTTTHFENKGTRLGLYLSNRLRPIDPLIFEIGGRFDDASYTGDRDWSPRTSAALRLGRGRMLRVGWGYYRQIQGIDDVAALNDDSRYHRSELSEQWTAGLEQLFQNGALLRVEAYFKEGTHLRPVYRNWKGGIDTFPETNEDRILVFPRRSTAKGLEFYYDHKLGDRISTRASYAYSIAREDVDRIQNVNTAEEAQFNARHPIPQDQRHAANVDLTYRFRQRWTINGSLAYHAGWPATLEELVQVTDENGETDFAVRPTTLYGSQLPRYFRFDVRATKRWNMSRGDLRFFVELVNLTNHSNIFGYDYFRTRDSRGDIVLQRDQESWFTILPSLGVAWNGSF